MIDQTISEIEAKISDAQSVTPAKKQELLKLLATLKAEMTTLSQTHAEHADSIAGFARISTHEATRTNQDPQLRELSLVGLRSSTGGFEQSHPQLVQVVNSISKMLSDLGI